MDFLFVLLLLGCLCSLVLSDQQGDALIELRKSLNASGQQLNDWNENQVNPCTWSRVNCDLNSNVIQVSLAMMGFPGHLTPKIGALKYLQTLSLQGNAITGDIPKEFGNLTSLVWLDLENNRLTGEIPSSLGNLEKLQFLALSQNNLSGTIPESLANISSLNEIQLDSNNLSGRIPQKLFQLSKYNFSGNNLDCGVSYGQPCAHNNADQGSSHKPTGLIIGVSIAFITIVVIGGLLLFWCKGRHKGYKREVFVDVAELKCCLSSTRYSLCSSLGVAFEITIMVKKLEREKRLEAIVDRNLNKNYNMQEVEMMIKVALLCTQATSEDRPLMSEVVRMLEGEGLAERWEEWQHVEVNRRQEYDRLQRRFDWGEDSVYNQDAIELSGGR
ncbi:hypothetical protein TSUD_79370 [Trifolium subterraneum]|uniref:Uncharacterized protein n=1 Tax=Trifolium subterraneum TaxID=3900 RepID=A0A2Z6LMX3_TRISU|nr:hypothetical protein TSUD_79370 [Trifolium subterraneum]